LQARANIYRYQQPQLDLAGWALEQVTWRGGERVLDVGCGPGQYLRRLAQRPGLQLHSAFERVERRDAQSALVIPEAAPVIAYVHSTRSMIEQLLPENINWEALLAEVERRLATEIAEHGNFQVRTHTGVFVCS
jgi:hypothetical protein